MTYEKLCAWIDMRYKCAHGNLEYKAHGKDDPMGLALFTESDALSQFPPTFPPPVDAPAETADDLDAFAEFDNDDDLATAEAEEEHVTRAALSSQSRQAKLLDVFLW